MITQAGITLPAGFEVDSYLYDAIGDWESRTRYVPFLSALEDQEFTYDPPGPNLTGRQRGGGRTLELRRGFIGISQVRTGVVPEDTDGTTLTEGTDYTLLPYEAGEGTEPYTQIEFTSVQFGAPGSVKVMGTPGYAAEIPARAWNAIRKLAGARVLGAMNESRATTGAKIKIGEDAKDNTAGLAESWGSRWKSEADDVLITFVRF